MKRLLFYLECLLFGIIFFLVFGYLPSAFYYADFNFVNWEDRIFCSLFGTVFFIIGVALRIFANNDIKNID